MVTIFICDDDKVCCEKNRIDVHNVCGKHGIQFITKMFCSGEELLYYLSYNPQDADIILLDVIMQGISGIDTAKQLRAQGCTAEIIFLTVSEEYALQAFGVGALHYLIKGSTSAEKLESTLLRAIKLFERTKREVFMFETMGEKFQVPYSSILYFKSSARAVEIHYGSCISEFTSTMKALEPMVQPKGCIRVHRSFIVNAKHVDRILNGNEMLLTHGEKIPLGDKYIENVKRRFRFMMLEAPSHEYERIIGGG